MKTMESTYTTIHDRSGNGGNYHDGNGGNHHGSENDSMLLATKNGNGGNYLHGGENDDTLVADPSAFQGGAETYHPETQQDIDQKFAALAAELGNVAIPA